MDISPQLRAMLDAAASQRNREADAVVELNGLLAARVAEVYALREQLAAAQEQIDSLRAQVQAGL
jgi:uncharacterized phage infection (PIP) family protein YhgE